MMPITEGIYIPHEGTVLDVYICRQDLEKKSVRQLNNYN